MREKPFDVKSKTPQDQNLHYNHQELQYCSLKLVIKQVLNNEATPKQDCIKSREEKGVKGQQMQPLFMDKNRSYMPPNSIQSVPNQKLR